MSTSRANQRRPFMAFVRHTQFDWLIIMVTPPVCHSIQRQSIVHVAGRTTTAVESFTSCVYLSVLNIGGCQHTWQILVGFFRSSSWHGACRAAASTRHVCYLYWPSVLWQACTKQKSRSIGKLKYVALRQIYIRWLKIAPATTAVCLRSHLQLLSRKNIHV